jgi:hypothetical protein
MSFLIEWRSLCRTTLMVHLHGLILKLTKLLILSNGEGVNGAPLFGCGKLGWVNMERGMPGLNRESRS